MTVQPNDRSALLDSRRISQAQYNDGDEDSSHDRPRAHISQQGQSDRRHSASLALRDTPNTERASRYFDAVHDGLIRDNAGSLLLLLAAFLISSMALSYTLLARIAADAQHPVTPLQVIFARMLFTWLGSVAILLVLKDPHPMFGPPGVRLLLCIRGVIGFFGLFSFYFSLRYLSLSDATLITFLSPLLTGVLCSVFLGEPLTRNEVLAGIASLVGIVLIARPKSLFGRGSPDGLSAGEKSINFKSGKFFAYREDVPEAQRLFAIAIAFIGVCAGAGGFTTIRAIGTRASALHSVSFFGLYSTLVSLVLGLGILRETWALPDRHWGEAAVLMTLCGGCGFAGQFLTAKGLQMCKGARGMTISYTQAIWSSLLQVIFLHEPIAPLSALGCLIILGSALTLAINR